MADLSPIQELIAAHSAALAEHNRLFELNDHGEIEDAAVYAALEPIDDALIALCLARPVAPEAEKLRVEFLSGVLVSAVAGIPSLAQRVFDALLKGGVS